MANIVFIPFCTNCKQIIDNLKIIQIISKEDPTKVTSTFIDPCKCPYCNSPIDVDCVDYGFNDISQMFVRITENTTTS